MLKSKKLSLVVDLDQTIIHATVDPTVAEWQQDPNNPNHEAVKSVRAFQLVDDGPGARGCWYYIKLRPGLMEFLESVSEIYELHIYTMGTRAYAQNIANIVDPQRKIFGDRILSRDESGSLTAKSLQRLFPVDTKMVVIIDDRGDVWHWSANLIKVTPYDFFVGIGDINSSFLPRRIEPPQGPKTLRLTIPRPTADLADGATAKRPEPELAQEASDTPPSKDGTVGRNASTVSDTSTLEQLVSMSGADDPTMLQQQASRQDEALAAQLEDRPLLQKQKLLDAEDEAAAATADADVDENTDESSAEVARPRHNLLHDDDNELHYLERSLRAIHRAFFEEYHKKLSKGQGGRLAELRDGRNPKKLPVREDDADLEVVPDVKDIMPLMKTRVLEGATLVFSGIVPLGTDIQRYPSSKDALSNSLLTERNHRADIALWAKSFGAQVSERVNRHTTHVIAGRNRTNKVRQAARRPHINVVSMQWLLDSMSRWEWLDEEPYAIPIDPEDREPQSSGNAARDGSYEHADDAAFLSSSEGGTGPVSEDEGDRGDAADLDDPEGVRPADLENNHSPIDGFENYAWKEIDSELAEFLGSDGEDSDAESVNAESERQSAAGGKKRKRSRSSTPSETDENTAQDSKEKGTTTTEDQSASRLAKRQLLARQRSTGLKSVASATDNGSSLPTPEITGAEEDGEDGNNDMPMKQGGDDDKNHDDDHDGDELERELEAEMEKELSIDDNGL